MLIIFASQVTNYLKMEDNDFEVFKFIREILAAQIALKVVRKVSGFLVQIDCYERKVKRRRRGDCGRRLGEDILLSFDYSIKRLTNVLNKNVYVSARSL